MMKKLLVLLLFIPLVGFAATENKQPRFFSLFKKDCERIKDPAQRKKACLANEKKKMAEHNYRNFQKNSKLNARS